MATAKRIIPKCGHPRSQHKARGMCAHCYGAWQVRERYTSKVDLTREQEQEAVMLMVRSLRENPEAARTLLERNHRNWLRIMLPAHFRSNDEKQFAEHHDRFFRWGWDAQKETRLEKPACLWIVNRGGNKSTSAAGLAVKLGATGQRKFGLVVTRTQPQADKHVRTINGMLLSSQIPRFYPDMASYNLTTVENKQVRAAWNREQLTTGAGWTLTGFGLLSAQRGIRIEQYRPDFIWVTDVDEESDTVGMVETLEDALSGAVFGTMSQDCMIVFDQNLIHKGGVLNRVLTRTTDMLSNREEIGPIPAIYNPSYEREDGVWKIPQGRPSWPGLDIKACEATLNVVKKHMWEREYQHNLDLPYPDAIYPMFDPVYHCITWDEFAAFFLEQQPRGIDWGLFDSERRPRVPKHGYISFVEDWGNNRKHPCANRWQWRPGQGMPLQKFRFFYRERCWPTFPHKDQDEREHPSVIKLAKFIHEQEAPWNEGPQVISRRASHERPEIIESYLSDVPLLKVNGVAMEPLVFSSVDTALARQGILTMQTLLTLDDELPHPFRVFPKGHARAGRPLDKCPMAFFITAVGQSEPYMDQRGELAALPALNEDGQARTRFEYANYRKPDTAQGDEKKDPPKRDDDIIDCDRAIAGDDEVEPLTAEERLALRMMKRFPLDAMPQELRAQEAWLTSRNYWATSIANDEARNQGDSYGGALGGDY